MLNTMRPAPVDANSPTHTHPMFHFKAVLLPVREFGVST